MKKILSVVLLFTMLISCVPMAFATGETVIPLSATERTVIGYAQGSDEATYSITDCYGSSFTFDEKDIYHKYSIPYKSLIDYKVNAAESGRYSVSMYMAGFYHTDYVMDVFVDECLAITKVLPPCTSFTTVDFGAINLTAGEHTIGLRLSCDSYRPSIGLRAIYFEKVGSLQRVAFRATAYESATIENPNAEPIAAVYNKFDGNYSDYAQYGESNLWTNGGTVLAYDLGLAESGTYTLYANIQENGGAIVVKTGADFESATIKLSGFEVENAPEWVDSETTETALIKVGDVEIAAGDKLYIQFTQTQQRLYHFELAHITPLALLDEINAATDPHAVKGIFAQYNGVPAGDINAKLNNMFFAGFVGAELIGKNFASFDELVAAFDAAYAKEADEHNIRLHYVGRLNSAETGSVNVNSDYQIRIKKNVLEPGTLVLFASYRSENRLGKVTSGVVEADTELTVGDVWINPGERYEIFFWDGFNSLKPQNIFN